MKTLYLFILISFFLVSCKSAGEGFKLKKKSSADEFLVEKKSPLVLPPEYGKLPKPGSDQIIKENDNEIDFKTILTEDKNSTQKKKSNLKPSSIEDSILKKIK